MGNSFEEYFVVLRAKVPTGKKVSMTLEQFEKMQRQAFDRGVKHGQRMMNTFNGGEYDPFGFMRDRG